MDPSAFPTVATVIGFTPDSDSGPLVATLACPITSEEVEIPVSGHESPSANINETIHIESDDPVTKALVDNIVGNLPTKKPVVKLRCEICNIEVTGKAVFDLHLAGAKHFKKMKLIESLAKSKEQAEVCKPTAPNPLLCFKCEVCNVSVNSIQQLQVHSQGTKHKNNVANLSQKKNKPLEQEPLRCYPAQSGKKHKNNVANLSQKKNKPLEQEPLRCYPAHSGTKHYNVSQIQNKPLEQEPFRCYPAHSGTKHDNVSQIQNKPLEQKPLRCYPAHSGTKHNNVSQIQNKPLEQEPFRCYPAHSGVAVTKFSCSTCNIDVNSAIQLEQHESSRKHLEMISTSNVSSITINRFESYSRAKVAQSHTSRNFVQKKNSTVSSISHNRFNPYSKEKAFHLKPPTGAADATFSCSVCNIILNSATQFQQHKASKKHAEKVSDYARPSDLVEKMEIPNANSSGRSKESDQTYFFADVRERPPFKAKSTSTSKESDQILFADLRERPPLKAKSTCLSKESGQILFADLRERPPLKGAKSIGGGGVKSFKCHACNVSTNSMVQLQQHYKSWKHIENIEGTPAFKDRPKLSTPPQTYLTKNAFKNGIVTKRKSMGDLAGPQKFSSSTVCKTPDCVSPQQPLLNRMLNNLKSNSDQHANLFSRFLKK